MKQWKDHFTAEVGQRLHSKKYGKGRVIKKVYSKVQTEAVPDKRSAIGVEVEFKHGRRRTLYFEDERLSITKL